MARKTSESTPDVRGMRPAITPEARESQLIALAVDRAEQQLRDGTASSQVICHYLKLGSSRAKLEAKILEEQAKLYSAKSNAINQGAVNDQKLEEAIAAMKRYSGNADA